MWWTISRAMERSGEGVGAAVPVYNWPWLFAAFAVLAVVAYFCGCFNGAVIVSKYILKDDVRDHGSGNAGLTNFHRAFGGKLTAVVLLLDVVKMIVAVAAAVVLGYFLTAKYTTWDVFFARYLTPWVPWLRDWDVVGHSWLIFAKCWAGLWCLLGHMFPVTFGFKGGKGVLSGVTLMFCLDWRMGLIAMGIFLIVVALTRYVSLGSCIAAVSFPVSTWLFVSREPLILVMSIALAGLVIFMHRGNLARVARGEERRFSFHRKKD